MKRKRTMLATVVLAALVAVAAWLAGEATGLPHETDDWPEDDGPDGYVADPYAAGEIP